MTKKYPKRHDEKHIYRRGGENRRKGHMHELKIFESPEFGTERTVTINAEPWLVGKDVAEALGYSNTRKALEDHVDAEDKM